MISKLIKLKKSNIKPKWFLRQAGRHIPEYYSIRNKHDSFIDFCLDENSIVDATILFTLYKSCKGLRARTICIVEQLGFEMILL